MLTLDKVCEIAGITPQTMLKYEEIGLVAPAKIDEIAGRLYDNFAVSKLFMAHIFSECGYDYASIKNILDLSEHEISEELYRTLDKLEEKRRKIDGLIGVINMCKSVMDTLTEADIGLDDRIDMIGVYDKMGVSSFSDLIDTFASSTDDDDYDDDDDDDDGDDDDGDDDDDFDDEFDPLEEEKIYKYIASLTILGCCVNQPEDSPEVQKLIENSFRSMAEIGALCEEYDDDADPSEAELANSFYEHTCELLDMPEFRETIEAACGPNSVDYILRSIKLFADSKG